MSETSGKILSCYKNNMKWTEELKLEDLPQGKLYTIAERCGISDAVLLCEKVPGLQIYIPHYGHRKMQRDYVKENFTGKNMLSIAVHLGIDTTKVRYFSRQKSGYERAVFSNQYMKIVASKCGKDVAIRLLEQFPGEHIYIPINWFSDIRRRKIETEFNGDNSSKLALKYHVSERYIKKIISDFYHKKSDLQLDLFPVLS